MATTQPSDVKIIKRMFWHLNFSLGKREKTNRKNVVLKYNDFDVKHYQIYAKFLCRCDEITQMFLLF